MTNILLVEDDKSLQEALENLLSLHDYTVVSVATVADAQARYAQEQFELVLSDFRLPDASGIDLLSSIRSTDTSTPFILMTAYGSIAIATEAMKKGAQDFLCKPFEPVELLDAIEEVRTYNRIVSRQNSGSVADKRTYLTRDPEVQHILDQATRAARVTSSILLLGESGTGKEIMARHIHQQSPRAEAPFVAINCSAFPPDLLESELFGHVAGAYTGATQERQGLFEFASDGTLFLDELGDMPKELQVKLLRALQEGEIRKLGSTQSVVATPRIIAATNHSLHSLLEKGALREDLYYRIAVISLSLPPLRERPDDLAFLLDHFIQTHSQRMGFESKKLSKEARTLLLSYHWPGNIRELENTVERALLFAPEVIEPEHLGISLKPFTHSPLQEIAKNASQEAEKEVIRQALHHTGGNKSRAAELLQVSYKTLLAKIKNYGLGSRPAQSESTEDSVQV